jgi:hypothetical protein
MLYVFVFIMSYLLILTALLELTHVILTASLGDRHQFTTVRANKMAKGDEAVYLTKCSSNLTPRSQALKSVHTNTYFKDTPGPVPGISITLEIVSVRIVQRKQIKGK